MDKLDRKIADKQADLERTSKEIEALARKHERLLIELEALKQAAELRPTGRVGNGPSATAEPRSRGGRQPGGISADWRKVLRVLSKRTKGASYDDILEAAIAQGISTKMPNVRGRVRNMVENGLLSGGSKRGFKVTPEAVRRFGLDAPSFLD